MQPSRSSVNSSASPSPSASGQLPRELLLGFAPLHKAAFGVAVGVAGALLVFAATALTILRGTEHLIHLGLLATYFRGYSTSWGGALIGAAWGGLVGFIFGWFTAFVRNLVMAVSLFLIWTRADLERTREFLDHI